MTNEEGVPGEEACSPGLLANLLARGPDGAGGALMPGGQARMSGIPPLRRSKRPSHSCLTACPAARRPLAVAGEGRAFGACCFAGKLRSPARRRDDGAHPARLQGGSPTAFPTSTPTSLSTRWGCVPLASLAERISAGHAPLGGVERTGRVVRFARFIGLSAFLADLRSASPNGGISA